MKLWIAKNIERRAHISERLMVRQKTIKKKKTMTENCNTGRRYLKKEGEIDMVEKALREVIVKGV